MSAWLRFLASRLPRTRVSAAHFAFQRGMLNTGELVQRQIAFDGAWLVTVELDTTLYFADSLAA